MCTRCCIQQYGPNDVIPKGAIVSRRLGNIIRYPFEDVDLRKIIRELPRKVKYNRGSN
jgi:hypothetical protein